MTKVVLHSVPSPEVRAELRQVARALQKIRRSTSDTFTNPSQFQLTIGGKGASHGQFLSDRNEQGEAERVEIIVSPEVLEHITRVIADAASEVVVATRSTRDEMTTQQAADLLGVSRPYLIKLIDAGKIPCRRVGHFRRIRRDDLERYEGVEQARREAGLTQLAAFTQEMGLEY